MKRVIIDTDPGEDDAAAIMWCLAAEQIEVDCLTITHGNVEVDQCARNALLLLEIAGRPDIPVYRGVNKPLLRTAWHAKGVHGADGFGDAALPEPSTPLAGAQAAAELIRRCQEAPGEISLLALGPLTNLALALRIESRLSQWVKEIVLMGGAVRTAGNVTPVATFNIAVDPEAAAIVYDSGIPLVQVGLDVCNHVEETDRHWIEVEQANSPVAAFLLKIVQFRRDRAARQMDELGGRFQVPGMANIDVPAHVTGQGIRLNDVPAAGYLVAPELFRGEELFVAIETKGAYTAGVTVADFRGQYGQPPNATVLLEVDGPQLVERWVQDITNYNKTA